MSSILVVEDNIQLLRAFRLALESKQHVVTTVSTVSEALEILEKTSFDVAVIDRVLGAEDGLELVEYLYDLSFFTRVLVITQQNESIDRIIGLRRGADDYVGKPISQEEFLLRVQRLLEKEKSKPVEYLKINDIKVFPSTGEVFVGKKRKMLRKKELQIFHCLLQNKNSTVTRDMIINTIWYGEQEIPTYTTIDVYLRRIRLILGERGTLIKTVRGFGYMLKDR